MADAIASLPPAGWLVLLFLAAVIPLLVCLTLLLVAFVPSGAGRAGWRNPIRLPRREGVASWSQLHPAFPAHMKQRLLLGRKEPAAQVHVLRPWPSVRQALAHLATDLQRAGAAVVTASDLSRQ
jgi:hypothetical protein